MARPLVVGVVAMTTVAGACAGGEAPGDGLPASGSATAVVPAPATDRTATTDATLTANGPTEPTAPTTVDLDAGLSAPLVTDRFTADPSAHVFDGRLYVITSHDIETGVPQDDEGSHFGMRDYLVLSMDAVGGEVTEHGPVLDLDTVPWAAQQMWAPDFTEHDGRFYLYFPAKDVDGVFRIGVATADRPEGPYAAEPEPIDGTYSIDPAVFTDTDGARYLYFGGIWGGQLQRWRTGEYREDDTQPGDDEPALTPKVARLADDPLALAEPARDVVIVDAVGEPLRSGDTERRYFEAPWMHRYDGTYYLTYSTGDTHLIAYATSDSPYGPFTYGGTVLEPVVGWTTHHSIVEHDGRWYLFAHDSELSGGQTHLRSVKVVELVHEADGSIRTIAPYG